MVFSENKEYKNLISGPGIHIINHKIEDPDVYVDVNGNYELFFTVEKNNYDSFKNRINKYKIDAYIIGETYDGPNMVYYDIVILCSFPVPLSLAETFNMPLASISNVTSICGTPLGAGGIPSRLNIPSDTSSLASGLSP